MTKWLFPPLLCAAFLASCGSGDVSSQSLMTALPGQSPQSTTAASIATSPSPAAKTLAATNLTATPVNDSLVFDAAVPSLDSKTYGPRTYQGVPSIARVGSRLWAVWFGDVTAAKWEATGNFLILAYSDNDGRSWSREFYLVPAHPGTDRAFDPRLWLAPDGKLWVIYSQAGGGMIFDGQLGAWVNVISDPLAPMPTFEPGFRLADGQPHRPFQYQGQWYIPIDYLGGNPTRFRERQGKHVYALNWQQRTATKVTSIPKTPNADFNEPTFVALKDGSLLNQSRSYDGIYQSQTAAGSLVFPEMSRWTFYPSAASRHSLSRSPSGRLVMVWNQTNNGAGRTDMAIALSSDDGKSWPDALVFDARPQVSYPDVDYAANGNILAIYDRGRNGYKEIWLAIIDEGSVLRRKAKVTLRLVNVPVAP